MDLSQVGIKKKITSTGLWVAFQMSKHPNPVESEHEDSFSFSAFVFVLEYPLRISCNFIWILFME